MGMSVKKLPIYKVLRTVWRQGLKPLELNPYLQFVPPGHFYSPIPDQAFVAKHKDRLFDRRVEEIPGIALNARGQLALVEAFGSFYPEQPFHREKTSGVRYYFENSFFSYADAIALYSMLRHFRPRRVVEVGVGFSSAVMLDTSDLFLSKGISFTFVDPYPERLESLASQADIAANRLLRVPVQDVPPGVFESLEANDILFIDSSHVVKVGSDVVHLLTYVLPRLREGVLIHFHDVFWPFEYPEQWVAEGRAWNEDYVLKAFLQFNETFEILFFNSYLATHHAQSLERHLPLALENPGGSLWIRKNRR
jgi:predicted O-methyltransferase YrrM